jgi:thymidylate kinase
MAQLATKFSTFDNGCHYGVLYARFAANCYRIVTDAPTNEFGQRNCDPFLSFQDKEGKKMPITDKVVARSEQPMLPEVIEERRDQLRRLHDRDFSLLEKIPLDSRVLIIEGISGSGKDTFQKYLKSKLRSQVVYDYCEGELLLSWNQRPIKDIFKLQVRLMRNFIDYMADTINRDDRAVFLLNRFHLSTYTMGVTEQPKLEREYNIVLKKLRTLPTHVFILQLMESEIESRSSHPERGAAWHNFQQHILKREGFQNFVNRNALLQKAMVETAIRQQIPFSILRLPSALNTRITRRRSPITKITENLRASLDHER